MRCSKRRRILGRAKYNREMKEASKKGEAEPMPAATAPEVVVSSPEKWRKH